MRTPGRLALLLPLLVPLVACGGGGYSISGRSHDPCLEEIPACPHAGFAECSLDPHRYAERRFPGVFNFLVDIDAGSEVGVMLVFVEQADTGMTTQITWNEPGCTDSYTVNIEGADLFAESRDIGVISREQAFTEGGEHLIEVDSDMQAVVLITVDFLVTDPEDGGQP